MQPLSDAEIVAFFVDLYVEECLGEYRLIERTAIIVALELLRLYIDVEERTPDSLLWDIVDLVGPIVLAVIAFLFRWRRPIAFA